MAKKKERTLITALLALGLGILLVVFREYAFGDTLKQGDKC